MKRIISACVLMVLMHTAAHASLCVPPTVEKNSPYRYLVSVANALEYAKEGLARVDAADPKGGAYSLLVALKLQQSDYQCAESQVAPYAASSDTLISGAARHVTFIFHQLGQVSDELISQMKVLVDQNTSTPPSDMAERQAKAQSDLEQTCGLLVHAAIFSTYTVIRADPTTGKMSLLALTAAQRDDILGTLRAGFGKEIIGGMKEGQHPVEAAAAALYQVVGNPQYQLRIAHALRHE